MIKFRDIFIMLIFVLGFNSLKAYAAVDRQWKELKSTQFIIYHKDVPRGFLEKVKSNAEGYYKEITNNLGFVRYDFWLWDKRAKIYIYPSREEYLEDELHPNWSAGIVHPEIKVIKSYPTDAGFIDTVLPHELGHIIFREFVRNNPTIPLWLDEGVACYQELAKRWTSNEEVRKAIKEKRFITVDKLSNHRLIDLTDRDTVNLFYAESASLTRYLIEKFGKFRFGNLCKDLRDGMTFQKALKRQYPFRNLKELGESWKQYIKD